MTATIFAMCGESASGESTYKKSTPRDSRCDMRASGQSDSRFSSGSIVVATLNNPREKFWGMILALAPEGLSLCGAELASFEDLATMVKEGEPFTPAVVFFSMHRIERVELDLPDGNLPSLSQRFFARTGIEPAAALSPEDADRRNAANDARDEPAPRTTKERA